MVQGSLDEMVPFRLHHKLKFPVEANGQYAAHLVPYLNRHTTSWTLLLAFLTPERPHQVVPFVSLADSETPDTYHAVFRSNFVFLEVLVLFDEIAPPHVGRQLLPAAPQNPHHCCCLDIARA